MLKLKLKNYISMLLVLILIFQFVPGTIGNNIECKGSHTPKAYIIISTTITHTAIAFLTSGGRRSSYHTISPEFYNCIIEQLCPGGVSENKSLYHVTHLDYRKTIKQAISHYFHGSKYKGGNLFS